MADNLDNLLDSAAKMPKPFMVSEEQWKEIQSGIAVAKAWKDSVDARLAALEAPK